MKNGFKGFPAEGIAFLRDLKKHNDRDWFTPRKPIFEEKVRVPMIELVRAVHGEMARFAPEYVGDAVKCVYRIYRDTRFSKDKTPYKTYVSALMLRNNFDRYDGSAAYYFAVSPEGIEVAGGIYKPDRETLLAVRQHIAANTAGFRATFENRKVKKLLGELQGESLSRVPKGFAADHPAVDLLKRKDYLLETKLDAKLATTPRLLGEMVARIAAMTPFIEYLNQPLVRQKAKRKRDEQFLK
jgi:uncharacterized protein (TIGR02453 family)